MSTLKRIVDCVASQSSPPFQRAKDVETLRCIVKYRTCYIYKLRMAKAHGYQWTPTICVSDTISVGLLLSPPVDREDIVEPATAVYANISIRCHQKKVCLPRLCFNRVNKWEITINICTFKEARALVENGCLVIETDIELVHPTTKHVWYPLFREQDLLKQVFPSETADVLFSVGEATFRAHKDLLRSQAKKLYELAAEYGDTNERIVIPSVKSKIFAQLIDFVYSVKAPVIDTDSTGVDLLVVADRLECLQLKLYVESVLVDKFLQTSNAASLLTLADAHSCALLKEAAIRLITIEPEKVRKSEGWQQIEGSLGLVNELFQSLSARSFNLEVGNASKTCRDDGAALDAWDVTDLRTSLHQHNLALDGSRKVLVNRLKAHKEANPETEL